jgi:hypothetical protein
VVHSIPDIESVLKQVKWTPDILGDWIQNPELTWGLKRGDCEDMAVLAAALLEQISIKAWLLSVIVLPARYSHAVCVFPYSSAYSYFSNGIPAKTGFSSIEDIVKKIANGHNIVYWSLENDMGKIITIKRGQ